MSELKSQTKQKEEVTGVKSNKTERSVSNKPLGNKAFEWNSMLYSFLIVCGFLFVGHILLNYFFSESASLNTYAKSIEIILHKQEKQVLEVEKDIPFLKRQVVGMAKLPLKDQQRDANKILHLGEQIFNIALYKNDSLIFWTNNRVFLPNSIKPSRLADLQLKKLKNGHYVIKRKQLELFENEWYDFVSFIPIKNEYNLPSEYLRNTFIGDQSIPTAVDICQTPTAFPIRAQNTKVISYLQNTSKFRDWRYQAALLPLYILGIGFLGYFLINLTRIFSNKLGNTGKSTIILGTALLVDFLIGQLDWNNQFNDLGVLTEIFQIPVFNGSLGSLLIDVVLSIGLVSYFHKNYQLSSYENSSIRKKYIITTAQYFAVALAAFLLTHVYNGVITNNDLHLDFENVLNLNTHSILAVLSLLIVMFGLFLFAHRLMTSIEELGLNRQLRVGSLLLALGLTVPIVLFVGSPLPYIQFYLGCLFFLLVYDMFVDSGESNVLWLFFWLVVMAMYSAALMFTFNEKRDVDVRKKYAETLSNPRDTIAERSLLTLVTQLRSDIDFQEKLAIQGRKIPTRDIIPIVERKLIEIGYLYNNYRYNLYGYDPITNNSFFIGQDSTECVFANNIYKSLPNVDEIRYELTSESPINYWIELTSDLIKEPKRRIFLQVAYENRSTSKVFRELLIDEQYRHLKMLPNYEYAIYFDGNLIQEAGGKHSLTINTKNLPEPGQFKTKTNSKYSQVTYTSDNGRTIVSVGKNMGGYWRPMSLFSYLFVWCIMLILIMSLINTYVDFLPTTIDITWIGKPDLKTKIQVGIVALVLLSFSMIGYVTVLYFHDSTDAYHDNRLNRKVSNILRNTEHEVQLLSEMMNVVSQSSLQRIIKPISEIHHMDVNLYDLQGDLISSSETDIFKRGIIAPKMAAYAFQMMQKRGLSQVVQKEAVGELNYRSAYVPVRIPSGQTIAYMGLPYYSKQRDLRDDVSSFMGTLLNVYVFLLLIAGVIAISVANSITKPLSELGNKIRQFKVDNKNEPLEWKARDELGALISEFNTMLITVEENAKELDNARREKAWREMAQQVAHEIKNPLTPMKLSIQYLKHAFDRDPDSGPALVNRVSRTLIEQIDNLSLIATTFSTFARMPEPVNEHFALDELVGSVYDLFREENVDTYLNIEEHTNFFVFADKKLLMRVLNNLIKNAIQAIPEERRGTIQVNLTKIEGQACISVKDNGSGIPDEMIEKVFFPKFTTKSSGTGLGLAICRDIIKAAKGKIYFETELEVGTTFYVKLPIVEEDTSTLAIDESTNVVSKA